MWIVILLSIILIFILYLISEYISNVEHGKELAKYFDQVPYKPIIGSLHLYPRDQGTSGLFYTMMGLHKKYGKDIVTRNLLLSPSLQVTNSKTVEKLLLSKSVKKSLIYKLFEAWLGTGLLMASGEKWLLRRRIVTPAFHFKILEGFLDVFQENEEKYINKLKFHVDKDEFDIYNYNALMALDSICETSMGVKINALDNPDNEYVKTVKAQAVVIFRRIFSLFRSYRKLFIFTSLYWEQRRHLKILHAFTNKVIRERRQLLESKQSEGIDIVTEDEEGTLAKKRLSLLDLMLNVEETGTVLSDTDIREEVDTFMFAGHDTTTAALSFTIYNLSQNQDVQEKVFHEILAIIGDDPKSVHLTSRMLNDLKYLEMVIKETQRLYATVPIIGRTPVEDLDVGDGKIIKKGTDIAICIYAMHRDEDLYPDPLKFDPERFSDENQSKRRPYDFIPFSAGPRNCIGQKYALLEIKSAIVKLLGHYKIFAGQTELKYNCDLTLRPENGIFVKIIKRQY